MPISIFLDLFNYDANIYPYLQICFITPINLSYIISPTPHYRFNCLLAAQPPTSSPTSTGIPFNDLDKQIALHQGKWSITTHLITHFALNDRLIP